MTYNDSFQDRIANAAKAREKALEKLRSKKPLDPKIAAERVERQAQRAARDAEKAQAKRAAREAQAAEKAAKAAKAAEPAPPTEAERNVARDAKYAARKARR